MTSETIVVVGASRGIGRELVLQLAQHPQRKIIALARNGEALKAFSALANVETHVVDLAATDVRDRMTEILSGVERVDVLINNAGLLVNKAFPELTADELTTSYQVNVIGVMQTVQAALPKMQSGAHIVNISSMGGFQGTVKFAGLAAYSTSKAALVSFTELFAEEYKNTPIRMNCLCLGAVQTEMLAEAFPGYEAPTSAAEMAQFIADFALNGHRYFSGKILPVSVSTP